MPGGCRCTPLGADTPLSRSPFALRRLRAAERTAFSRPGPACTAACISETAPAICASACMRLSLARGAFATLLESRGVGGRFLEGTTHCSALPPRCVLRAPSSCQAAVPRERTGSGCASARPCDSQLQASLRCRPLADVARVTRRAAHGERARSELLQGAPPNVFRARRLCARLRTHARCELRARALWAQDLERAASACKALAACLRFAQRWIKRGGGVRPPFF